MRAVEGKCLIYGYELWRPQAALEPFEIDTGVYPEYPYCMKAVAKGEVDLCVEEFTYLYPDGTLGDVPWVLDAADPKGWRWVPVVASFTSR